MYAPHSFLTLPGSPGGRVEALESDGGGRGRRRGPPQIVSVKGAARSLQTSQEPLPFGRCRPPLAWTQGAHRRAHGTPATAGVKLAFCAESALF